MATVSLTNESKAYGVGIEGSDGDSMAKRSERVLLIPLLHVFFPSTRILFSDCERWRYVSKNKK